MKHIIKIIDYIFYRISLFYENTGNILGYDDDGYIEGSNLTSFLLACNFETIINIIQTCMMRKIPYSNFYIICFIYIAFCFLYFKRKKYQALKEQYKNEINKKKKGYVVFAYVIISFIIFIASFVINSIIVN